MKVLNIFAFLALCATLHRAVVMRAQEKYVMESEFPPSVLSQSIIMRASLRLASVLRLLKRSLSVMGAKVISHRKCIIFNAITIIRQFGKLDSAPQLLSSDFSQRNERCLLW